MVDFKAFSDKRMQELIGSWNKEPNDKVFIDTMIHSKYNYPLQHDEVLQFVKSNFGLSIAGDWDWNSRTNKVNIDIDMKQTIMGFVAGQHLRD